MLCFCPGVLKLKAHRGRLMHITSGLTVEANRWNFRCGRHCLASHGIAAIVVMPCALSLDSWTVAGRSRSLSRPSLLDAPVRRRNLPQLPRKSSGVSHSIALATFATVSRAWPNNDRKARATAAHWRMARHNRKATACLFRKSAAKGITQRMRGAHAQAFTCVCFFGGLASIRRRLAIRVWLVSAERLPTTSSASSCTRALCAA